MKSAASKRKAAALTAAIPPNPPRNATFDSHLRATIAHLRQSVADTLAAVNANVRVPHSITRDFGLDKSLAAKLARVVREPDPYAAVLDVPGEEAMRIFSRTMRDAGAPAETLEALHTSLASFQQMVITHCGGNRSTLEMLAATASGGVSSKQKQQLETFRKNMFRGASAVFGVQARVQVAADFISPSRADASKYDVTLLNGLVDLRRIRSDVTWAVSSMRTIKKDGSPGPLLPVEPLDESCDVAKGQAPLIREFCSSPVPDLRITDTVDSIRRFELPEGPVGSTSAVTIFTGWTYRDASTRTAAPDDIYREHFVSLHTPVELVVHDLFVHKDLAFARHPGVHHYSAMPGCVAYPNGPRDRGLLPLFEQIEDLSGCPVHPASAYVPQYARLVRYSMERLGFTLDDFYGVRIQLAYPAIPSMLLYRYEPPQAAHSA